MNRKMEPSIQSLEFRGFVRALRAEQFWELVLVGFEGSGLVCLGVQDFRVLVIWG